MDMNVATSIGAYSSAYGVTAAPKTKEAEETANASESAAASQPQNTEAAVYEPSSKVTALSKDQINEMKADMQSRMKELMWNALKNQSTLYNTAFGGKGGNSEDLGDALGKIFGKNGLLENGKITVDAATRKEAAESISENGYWGVEKTSERLVKYATALTGGDPEKLDTMIEAVKKGFKEATKSWGGDLPGISQRTYDATMQKFQKLKEQNGIAAASAMGASA